MPGAFENILAAQLPTLNAHFGESVTLYPYHADPISGTGRRVFSPDQVRYEPDGRMIIAHDEIYLPVDTFPSPKLADQLDYQAERWNISRIIKVFGGETHVEISRRLPADTIAAGQREVR